MPFCPTTAPLRAVGTIFELLESLNMAYYCVQGCKLCVTEPCKVCARGCQGCFGAFDHACSSVSRFLCPPDRASPVFLMYTLGLNAIPGAIAVAIAAVHYHNNCERQLALWLLVSALIFNLFMIGFAARLHTVYNRPGSLGQSRSPGESIERFLHICWWEPLVCAYFFMWPAGVAWSIAGLLWAANSAAAKRHHPSQTCPTALITMTRVSAALLLVYLALSFTVALIGCLCNSVCAVFRTADEENAAYNEYRQVGDPPTRPTGGFSLDPARGFINSLFHPQQQWQEPARVDYDALPSDAPPSAQHFDPQQPPPPSGYTSPPPPQNFQTNGGQGQNGRQTVQSTSDSGGKKRSPVPPLKLPLRE